MVYVAPNDIVITEIAAWPGSLDLEAYCPADFVAVAPWLYTHSSHDPRIVIHWTAPREGDPRAWGLGVVNDHTKGVAAVGLGAVCVSGIGVGGEIG